LKELRDFERIDISKTRVIYNGIDFNEIPSVDLPIASERDESEYTLIYAGRLFWMKGVQFVLMAYKNLRKQFKNLRLRIFGQGPMRNEVERFITSKGLGKDVFFGGLLPHKMLLKEIAKSDIAVFPSLYESQPMFILEAMACKKALVAFDLPYSREMIRNGYNGLLARAYDVKDLSDKIALSLLDRTLRLELGRNAYNYARENHDWSKQAEKYLKIYSEAATF
jgi:glycosyltransferase involved in cell wall biosynthesis